MSIVHAGIGGQTHNTLRQRDGEIVKCVGLTPEVSELLVFLC